MTRTIKLNAIKNNELTIISTIRLIRPCETSSSVFKTTWPTLHSSPVLPASGSPFRLQSGYKMLTKTLKSFYVQYMITCHLTAYRASRNRFSAIRLHDYLHYCEIFLAHFLMKIDRNIILSLQYSLLTLRASWLV